MSCTWCKAPTFVDGVVCTVCYTEGLKLIGEVHMEAKSNAALTIEVSKLATLVRACEASISEFNKRVGTWEGTVRQAEQYRSVVAKDYEVVQQAKGAQHAIARIEADVKAAAKNAHNALQMGGELDLRLGKLEKAHFTEKTRIDHVLEQHTKRLVEVETTAGCAKSNFDNHLVWHRNQPEPCQEVDDPDSDNERVLLDLLGECSEMLGDLLKRERSAMHRALMHSLLGKIEDARADFEG